MPDPIMSALRGAEGIGAAPSPLWAILKKALTDPFGMGSGIEALNEKRKSLAKAILPDVVEEPLQQFADMAVQTPGSLGTIYAPVPRNLGDIAALKQRLKPRTGPQGTKLHPMLETTQLIDTYVDRYPNAMSQIRRTKALRPSVDIGNRRGTGVRGQMGVSEEAAQEFVRRIQSNDPDAIDTYNAWLKAQGQPPAQLGLAEDVELLSPVQRHLVLAEELDHLGQWLKDPARRMAEQNAYNQFLDYDMNPLEMRAKSAARARVGANVGRASLLGERQGKYPQAIKQYVEEIRQQLMTPPGRPTKPPVQALREALYDPMTGQLKEGTDFIRSMDDITGLMTRDPGMLIEYQLMQKFAQSKNPVMRQLLAGMMAEFEARGGRFASQLGQAPGVIDVLQRLGITPQQLGFGRP